MVKQEKGKARHKYSNVILSTDIWKDYLWF